MIGTSIALGIWTTGLLWVSVRAEQRRAVVVSEEEISEGAKSEDAPRNDAMTNSLDEKV